MKSDILPLELKGNHCHITPECVETTGQQAWFINAPYGGDVLRFRGEPTSLLYAIAPLVEAIRIAETAGISRFGPAQMRDLALLNPPVASEGFYSELKQRLGRQDVRLLGVCAMTAGSAEARRIAALAKEVNPRTVVVFGGPHETQVKVPTAIDPKFKGLVDFSVSGAGEFVLIELAAFILGNPTASADEIKAAIVQARESFLDCPGSGFVAFHHDDHNVHLPLSKQPLKLDNLPLIPRELLCEEDTRTFTVFKARGSNVKTAQVMTHRGCAWSCNFCTEAVALNERSVTSVIRELEAVLSFSRNVSGIPRQDYQAIFFDDSTFTTRASRRRQYLEELFSYLSGKGVEWGCQTRLDQMDESILRKMKDAGCTYVFTGMESGSDKMLWSMRKGATRGQIEHGFEAVNATGLRLGVSLVFGAAYENSVHTLEDQQTVRDTIAFVKGQAEHGNIVLVSPNVMTYYPGASITDELLKVTVASALEESGVLRRLQNGGESVAEVYEHITFRDPLVNRGFPWNRFEEGEGWHVSNFGPADAAHVIDECVRHLGEYLVNQDFFGLDEYSEAIRGGHLEAAGIPHVYLNHASISKPLKEAWDAASRCATEPPSTARCIEAATKARRQASRLFGLPSEEEPWIVLARNCTEATSFVYWLAGLHETASPRILSTSSENMSIPRAFRFIMDHGNSEGRDFWSSFQDFGVSRESRPVERRGTGAQVSIIDLESGASSPEEAILAAVDSSTSLVTFSHVLRDSGRIIDVKGLCEAIRRRAPDALLLVDGAQAIGALPLFSVSDLGCDFYVGAPHKTIGCLPLGLLYCGERVRDRARRFLSPQGATAEFQAGLLRGMLDPALEGRLHTTGLLSIPELVGFDVAAETLHARFGGQGCWLDGLDRHRGHLKRLATQAVSAQVSGVEFTSPIGSDYSHFILTLRNPVADNRLAAEKLWKDEGVFVSYLARADVIRLSFGPQNEDAGIRFAVEGYKRAIGKCTLRETPRTTIGPIVTTAAIR